MKQIHSFISQLCYYAFWPVYLLPSAYPSTDDDGGIRWWQMFFCHIKLAWTNFSYTRVFYANIYTETAEKEVQNAALLLYSSGRKILANCVISERATNVLLHTSSARGNGQGGKHRSHFLTSPRATQALPVKFDLSIWREGTLPWQYETLYSFYGFILVRFTKLYAWERRGLFRKNWRRPHAIRK